MDHSEGQLIVDTMRKAHKHYRNSDSASLTSSCLAKTMQIMSPNEDKKKGNNSKKKSLDNTVVFKKPNKMALHYLRVLN